MTTRMDTTDVLIVGAGPTGLALAFQLRRMGVACRLVEKNAGPSTTSKALGLQYRVSEVLAWMGLAPEFLARPIQQENDIKSVCFAARGEIGKTAAGQFQEHEPLRQDGILAQQPVAVEGARVSGQKRIAGIEAHRR